MGTPPIRRGAVERLEAWLWTGPVGHLYGGLTDFALLIGRIGAARLRAALGRRPSGR
jgi:hypothetical protein